MSSDAAPTTDVDAGLAALFASGAAEAGSAAETTGEPVRDSIGAEPVVELVDLVLRRRSAATLRGERVVDGVTARCLPGSALAVMGGTGSGKSSLAAALSGGVGRTLRLVGGRGSVAGVALGRGRASRRRLEIAVGVQTQRAGATLPGRFTAEEIIGAPVTSRTRHVNASALALRIATLLDELGLPLGVATKAPFELSAGMRQRVALARALVLDPPVLVVDEPHANLDVEARGIVDGVLARRREAGAALVLITNELDLAARHDADVVVLRHGAPIGEGRHDDIAWTLGLDPERERERLVGGA